MGTFFAHYRGVGKLFFSQGDPNMETALHLLMRDGAARIAFYPHLTPEQYAEIAGACGRRNDVGAGRPLGN
jgi:hypothetical protein